MNRTELAAHDGREGRKAYVAVGGTVYDVTDSPLWKNGLHPPDHQAGKDMTEELSQAPHVRAVVERFPVVGTLEEDKPQPVSGGGGRITIGIIIVAVIAAIILFLLL